MKICTSVDLGDIIMDVKFKYEKFMDFDVIVGQNSPFPIDFVRGPYHSAALCAACDAALYAACDRSAAL